MGYIPPMQSTVPIKKFDSAKQLVYGEVYIPMVLDSDNDFKTAETIERDAHRFLSSGNVNKIDTNHDLNTNGSFVVESFIARKGDPDFIEGSWVMGVHIVDPELWQEVVKGELNGFSLYGVGQKQSKLIEIEIPDDGIVKGETQGSEDHTHEYIVKFSSEGKFLGGSTTEVNGHTHTITKGTATDKANNHSHRFSYLEYM